jgi:hypothetical protein
VDPVRAGLLAALLPAVVAAVVLLALRLIRRGATDAAAAGPALAAGFIATFLAVAGAPRLPPTDAWKWLPFIAMVALVAVRTERRALLLWNRWTTRAAAALFAAWVTDVERTELRVAAAVATALVVAAAFDGVARRGTRTLLGALVVVAAATSATLFITGTANLGLASGALAASAGAAFVLAGRLGVSSAGAATVASTVLVALWLNGVVLAETKLASALLLAAAPFAAWTPVPAAESRPARAATARIALVAFVAGAAVAVAVVYAPKLDY